MLSTPLTCCSIGVATDCSTTSADAPGYVVSTRIVGGESSGYCSMESFCRVATPTRTMTIEMTIATVGRRMKNSAIASVRGSGRGRRRRGQDQLGIADLHHRRLHLHAPLHFLQPLDDDALARLQALLDDPEGADARARPHRAHLHRVARRHHRHIV